MNVKTDSRQMDRRIWDSKDLNATFSRSGKNGAVRQCWENLCFRMTDYLMSSLVKHP